DLSSTLRVPVRFPPSVRKPLRASVRAQPLSSHAPWLVRDLQQLTKLQPNSSGEMNPAAVLRRLGGILPRPLVFFRIATTPTPARPVLPQLVARRRVAETRAGVDRCGRSSFQR